MQTIYLDISNKGVVPTVYAKQNDVGRKFAVILTDSGFPYIPANGSAFSVWYNGASGEGNYTYIGDKSAFSLSGNKVEVEMIVQMLSTHGDGVLCLTLNSPDGNQISSWNIPYICEFVPGAESEKAEEYYTAFSKAVEELPYPDETLSISGKSADAAAVGAALEGKAPAGYGYGGYAINIGAVNNEEELNNAVESVYSAMGDTETKMIRWSHYPSTNDWVFFAILSRSSANNGSLIAQSAVHGGSKIFKTKRNGTWQPVEWFNPPMDDGEEYRTTERWNGKAVYTKLESLGTTTAQFRTTLAFDRITNLVRCVPNLSAVICNDWDSYTFNDAGNSTTNDNAFYFLATRNGTTQIIVLAACGSLRTGLGLRAQFWYTKD